MIDSTERIKVYCLASFTEDEADEILTQLDDDSHHSYSAADVRIELIPWTEERDGGKEDILRLFLENQETEEDFMFFIDRNSLDLQDFLVADVRSAKNISRTSTSSVRWSAIEATGNSPAPDTRQSCPDTQIIFGRCGRDTGWYGSPYSGIKTTYLDLISGRVTFQKVVRPATSPRMSPSQERMLISSVLDVCDEAYSAQARAAKYQASLLQAKSADGHHDEVYDQAVPPRDVRNSFCLSSKRWALPA